MATFIAHGNASLRNWDLSALTTATLQSHGADHFSLLAGDGTVSTFAGAGFGHFNGGIPHQGTITHIDVNGANGFALDDFSLSAHDFLSFANHGKVAQLAQAVFAGDDTFDVTDGAQNALSGFGGNDTFNFGGTFDGGDKVDGGDGYDTLVLDGDYSQTTGFGADTMHNIEGLTVASGNDYNLVLDRHNLGATDTLNIDAQTLRARDHFTFDGSTDRGAFNVNSGSGNDHIALGSGDDIVTGGDGRDVIDTGGGVDIVYGGAAADTIRSGGGDDTIYGDDGNDRLTPGSGHETVYGGAGDDDIFLRSRLGMADTIDGGDGYDTIHLRGADVSDFVLTAPAFTGIENIELGPKQKYAINLGSNPLTDPLNVDGSQLGTGDVLNLDASQVTGNAVTVIGGAANDTITGSGLGDVIQGGLGADTLTGGGGADTFRFASGADSTGNAIDTITDFNGALDAIQVANAVQGFDGTITSLLGSLNDLLGMLGVSNLAAGHAVAIQPLLGALAGDTLMVIDQNGIVGYQQGGDLVVNLADAANMGSLDLGSFI